VHAEGGKAVLRALYVGVAERPLLHTMGLLQVELVLGGGEVAVGVQAEVAVVQVAVQEAADVEVHDVMLGYRNYSTWLMICN
jgi:hypothetical protein